MKIIICGAGRVGFHLATYLSQQNVDITVVDKSVDLITTMNDRLDVNAVCGHACLPNVLEKAGMAEADMVIALTPQDEVNMMVCEVASALFEVPSKVARIRERSYFHPKWSSLFSENHINIDYALSPELEVAESIRRSLIFHGAQEVTPLCDDALHMVAVTCHQKTPLINTPIKYFTGLYPDLDLTVIGITRGEKQWIPDKEDVLLEGDKIHFIVDANLTPLAMIAFGYEGAAGGRVVIVGGGNVGLLLTQQIHHHFPQTSCVLIEKDPLRANKLADMCPKTLVLCGDGLDHDILEEANVAHAHTFISVTEDDRVNALSSLLAKTKGASYVQALVNNVGFENLVASLGVNAVINPRKITVSKILHFINREKVQAVHSLGGDFGEVMTFMVTPGSGLSGIKVEKIDQKNKIKVAGIVRQGRVIMPSSSTSVEQGDQITVMVASIPQHERPDFLQRNH